MNQMGHDIASMLGAKTRELDQRMRRIVPGGMVTVLKVRERPRPGDRDGWYRHPRGTVAAPADPDRMKADGADA
jgi:hypothetical protein